MKQQPLIKSLSVVALVLASSHASAQYSFVNVADTTMPIAPGGGTFTDLFPPPSFSGGSVAFVGRFGTTGQAIVTDSGGPLRVIAHTGGPGPFGTWSTPFNSLADISGNQVVFIGNGPSGQGVLVDDGGTLTIAARTGVSGPVGTWTIFGFGPPAISDGTAAFIGVGTPAAGVSIQGVFTENGGVFRTIAATGEGAPAGTFTSFGGVGGGVAVSGGTVAFFAIYNAGANAGIFTGDGVTRTLIVQRGYGGPVQVGQFNTFSPLAISGGNVAFGVQGSAGQGLFVADGSAPPVPIVMKGDSVPDVVPAATFSSFAAGGVSISSDTVAFSGRYSSDTARGIFMSSGASFTKVIATGEPLFGSVATEVNIGFSALDPDGSIAFYYALADGRKGVAIASPAPPNLPPVAVAAAGPGINLDDGDPTVLVMSLNGVDAAVTLDGTASYDLDDPPDLPLSYDWFADGSGSPIGSGVTFSTSLSVGLHTVALSVIDNRGLAGLIATIDVKVITRKDAITILEQKVNASSADLWRDADTQKHALNVKLAAAVADFVSGDSAGGCDKLSDFQNQLNAFVRSFQITPALAVELSALAETIRISIGCP